MAKQKSSTSGKKKPEPFRCVACGEKKPPTHFPSLKSDTCTDCANAALAAKPPEPSESTSTTLSAPASDIFTHSNAEADYNNPSAQELAARTLARRRLIRFITRFRAKYEIGWVHEDICRRLERFVERVERQEEPRLLLCVPVRHGKSDICSRHLPAWVLGKHPDWEIIAASGAQSLAMSFSRYLRDLMSDPSYAALYPAASLDPNARNVENWNMTAGGGYLAAGVGTMITGRGCQILIVDDPVRDAEEADSQVVRDKIWDWYISTALSRLAPGGGVLVCMTWWSEDDLAGRLQQLSEVEGADTFEVIKYPAINDQGDEYILADDSIVQVPPDSPPPKDARMTRPMNTALHPVRYSLAALLQRKATYYALGQQRWWAALYQQNPTPDEGAYFTKSMFRTYVNLPPKRERQLFQAWDFAITTTASADYTVGVTIAQDTNGHIMVVDRARFRADDSFVIVDEILNHWVAHGSEAVLGFEDGQIWKSIAAPFKRRCAERRLFPSYILLRPLTDKLARAQPLRGLMQGGRVWFPENAQWVDDMRNEMLRFNSGGKHDDQVDALAWAVRLALDASPPQKPSEQKLASWKDRLRLEMLGLGVDAGHMSA